tara:strand:- start:531 stop:1028 length:498 start_codon:yes stop_codon:yes gene_type:complete
MAVQTRSFLKNENTDFNNILDTVGGPQNVKSVNAATNLSTDDCGTVILGVVGTTQALTTGFNVNLPAPVRGAYFKFILAAPDIANNANAAITITSTSDGTTAADLIVGQIVGGATNEGANVVAVKDIVTFVHNVATAGDFFECVSDGTNWFGLGQYDADGAITLA